MTPTTYGRIERGGHTQTRKLLAIADALEVPIEDVLMVRDVRSGTDLQTVLQDHIARAVRQQLAAPDMPLRLEDKLDVFGKALELHATEEAHPRPKSQSPRVKPHRKHVKRS